MLLDKGATEGTDQQRGTGKAPKDWPHSKTWRRWLRPVPRERPEVRKSFGPDSFNRSVVGHAAGRDGPALRSLGLRPHVVFYN